MNFIRLQKRGMINSMHDQITQRWWYQVKELFSEYINLTLREWRGIWNRRRDLLQRWETDRRESHQTILTRALVQHLARTRREEWLYVVKFWQSLPVAWRQSHSPRWSHVHRWGRTEHSEPKFRDQNQPIYTSKLEGAQILINAKTQLAIHQTCLKNSASFLSSNFRNSLHKWSFPFLWEIEY